jgi:uncharacterized protein YoxC
VNEEELMVSFVPHIDELKDTLEELRSNVNGLKSKAEELKGKMERSKGDLADLKCLNKDLR